MAGAEMIVICTNTMHKVVPKVTSMINIPLVHIADATADALEEDNIGTVALLGTRYTMKQKLFDRGLTVLIPEDEQVEEVNRIIFEKLCLGAIKDDSRQYFAKVINQLKVKGAQAVILGCTEIGLLISQEDSSLPVFDTTVIHAKRAAQLALATD
ncbi:putative amino acid recemase [Streptococcus downei MFe28]|uniref:Putative amino acid recemase n=1 Tax=Streptococcus downei MFe28 TaxID=764290 RepID=A0A380JDR9_STRDO|nr:putative amino acid recemase [Streptococcus downei MFe28]